MKIILQRVTHASVTVNQNIIGEINHGLLVFIGFGESDHWDMAQKMIKKMINLRIFEDEEGRTNLSLQDVGGEVLLVSQFTLYADSKKGNRPSFTKAMSPTKAEALYHYFVEEFRKMYHGRVEIGEFGADMKVKILNDGPFTIILDSKELNM